MQSFLKFFYLFFYRYLSVNGTTLSIFWVYLLILLLMNPTVGLPQF